MNTRLNSNRNQKFFIKELSTVGKTGEALLWYSALKGRKMNGYQFHRQHPVGDSTVDFICKKLNLIIEIKGSSVQKIKLYDQKREEELSKLGYMVLSFSEEEVINQLDDVVSNLSYIIKSLDQNLKPDN